MNLISERPANIEPLGSILDRMVTYGGTRVSKPWQIYLRSMGAAQTADDGEWMWPTQHFLIDALPAASVTDLVRRVLLRDPLYRMHLDLSIFSVIHSVALAERWKRLEEILFAACPPAAPRLMQLLDWQMARSAQSARELSTADWDRVDEEVTGEYADTFLGWDRYLWGECRKATELFPLLLDLYLPLYTQPVHIICRNDHSDATIGARLGCLIKAAYEGEGCILPISELELLIQLQGCGLPIRTWNLDEKHAVACLVGRVACELEDDEPYGELTQVPSELPMLAKQSYLLRGRNSRPPTEWSALGTGSKTTVALYSLPSNSTRWPSESSGNHPNWLPLPGADVLATAGKRRSDSPAADEALSQIARHPLYGVMLQLLLLEALDRELGEETLVFALPQNRKLESFEDWADTKILYRPHEEKIGSEIGGFLSLGPLDEVIDTVAHELGVLCVVTAYPVESGGPWSRTLALMNTAGLVDGRPDRWILTITNYILDRLHSGSLMKEVIRGGRTARDKIHQVLTTLWQERSRLEMKDEVKT